MLISYLSSKVVELPFNSIPELIENTNFRIAVLPGSYHEDAFKYANDPYWKIAWKERIQPFIHEYKGTSVDDLIQVPIADPSTALYFAVPQLRSFRNHLCNCAKMILNRHFLGNFLSMSTVNLLAFKPSMTSNLLLMDFKRTRLM